MIKLKTYLSEHILKPTIFPDGTSQVWNLPDEILHAKELTVVWNFEAEREVMDLLSLRALVPNAELTLHMPYLPYGRQDKDVRNNATFNLSVFGNLINSMHFDKVTTVDAHNPDAFDLHFNDAVNINVEPLHRRLMEKLKPDALVFPDKGASVRYRIDHDNKIVCYKVRNQATGAITGHSIYNSTDLKPNTSLLIIDDICDGGATFISVAKELRDEQPGLKISLFVTHGIFSKGRQHLLDNGIDAVYTTNSLLKNTDGYEV